MDYVTITEYPLPVALISGQNEFCEGETILLHANASGSGCISIMPGTWTMVPISIKRYCTNVSQGGNYELVMSNYCGESLRCHYCQLKISYLI